MKTEEEIKCKYKFQNKEKFDGEEFCTLFLEKCKFLEEAGICDYNCQVYEDYKQLQRLRQENETIREHCKQVDKTNEILYGEKCKLIEQSEKIRDSLEKYQYSDQQHLLKVIEYEEALEEIRSIADKCKECLNEDDDCGCDYLRIVRKINEVLGNEKM